MSTSDLPPRPDPDRTPDDDLHELSGLYALDALDPSEVAVFERHLASCDQCQAEVASFRETMVLVVASVETDDFVALAPTEAGPLDPAALRARVLHDIGADTPVSAAPEPPRTAVVSLDAARTRRARLARVVAPLVAAAAVVVLGIAVLASRDDGGDDTAALLADLRAGGAVSLPMQGTAAGDASIVWSASSRTGVIVLSGLAPLDADHTYQAWTIDADARPHAAPAFRPDATGTALVALRSLPDTAAAVALTVEPRGGSAQPTTPVLLAAALA